MRVHAWSLNYEESFASLPCTNTEVVMSHVLLAHKKNGKVYGKEILVGVLGWMALKGSAMRYE